MRATLTPGITSVVEFLAVTRPAEVCISAGLFFSQLRRSSILVFFKNAAEIIAVVKADGRGYFGNAKAVFRQERNRFSCTDIVNIIHWTLACKGFEKAAEAVYSDEIKKQKTIVKKNEIKNLARAYINKLLRR